MADAKRYVVKTEAYGLNVSQWFYLFVYDTNIELQKAAKRYGPDGALAWDGVGGCFQPRMTVRYDKKGNPVRTSNTAFIGVMRLSRESLRWDIVVHESVHAALNLVRSAKMEVEPDMSDINNEEMLAYATQRISTAISDELWP